MTPQQFKQRALRGLPDVAGVYALCDLDDVPIYVGKADQSKDTSIRKRVQRHLTSARSDVIANRQLDVWEVAFVRGWAVSDADARTRLEHQLIHLFDQQSPLVNGSLPPLPEKLLVTQPEPVAIRVMPPDLLKSRLEPSIRFPRQVETFKQLLDYILNVQDKPHLRRALHVHYKRLTRYLELFDSDGLK
jgi:hypothetical protein